MTSEMQLNSFKILPQQVREWEKSAQHFLSGSEQPRHAGGKNPSLTARARSVFRWRRICRQFVLQRHAVAAAQPLKRPAHNQDEQFYRLGELVLL